MFRFLVAAALGAAIFAAVQDGRLVADTGLVGSCSAVTAPQGDAGSWQACKPGRLEGRPNLSRQSCASRGIHDGYEVWRCPAPPEGFEAAG